MTPIEIAERIYSYVPGNLTAFALALAFIALLFRLIGLRRGYIVSRPAALYGMIGTIFTMMVFYLMYGLFGLPPSFPARAGIVRTILILHSIAIVHWNWDYIIMMARRGKVLNGPF